MSMRGGFHAGLLVVMIVLFCFSVRLGRRVEGQVHAAALEPGWPMDLRLMCQPAARPDPILHRPHSPEHEDDPPALHARTHVSDHRVALRH